MTPKISVLINTYHPGRQATIPQVLEAWEREPVWEIWLLNGGTPIERSGRSVIFNMPHDLGNGMDYVFALLTAGDVIIMADDDFIPAPGQALVMAQQVAKLGGFVGVIGRRFVSPQYRENPFFRSSLVDKPEPVGFVGVCLACSREMFGFDVRGLHRNCDDIWLQMKVHPTEPKHVIPLTHYRNLKCCNDSSAMFKQGPEMQGQRQAFFAEQFEATYATGRGFNGC